MRALLATADVDLGGIRIQGHPVAVLDAAMLEFPLGRTSPVEFDGVLGWNAIRELRITLDNARGVLLFEPARHPAISRSEFVWVGKPFVRARAGNGLPLALFPRHGKCEVSHHQASPGQLLCGGRYGGDGGGGRRRHTPSPGDGIRGCRPARGGRAGTVRQTASPIPAGVAFARVHRRRTWKRCIDKRSRSDRFPGRRVLHLGRAMSPTILDELSEAIVLLTVE
jgi:hypothetical protein